MPASVISPNGQMVSSISPGKRVRLKGDSNSPEMTVVAMVTQQGTGQIMGAACGWSIPAIMNINGVPVAAENKQTSQFQSVQLALDAIELI